MNIKNMRYLYMMLQVVPQDLHEKLCKMSAAVKGYLTRRLLRTERVQNIIATIRVRYRSLS